MKEELSVVGKRLPLWDAHDKVTGATKYTVDIKLPEMLVGKVLKESPAAKADIRNGDIIVELAGSKVSRPVDLQMTVDRTPIGKKHELKLIRDGREMSVPVVLEEMER